MAGPSAGRVGRAAMAGLPAGSAGLAGRADFLTGMTAFLAANFLSRTIFLTGFLRAVIHFLRGPNAGPAITLGAVPAPRPTKPTQATKRTGIFSCGQGREAGYRSLRSAPTERVYK